MYNTVLLTLDGSDLAEQAVSHAVNVAKATSARLLVLRVVSLSSLPAGTTGYLPVVDPTVYQDVVDAEMADAQAYLDRQVEKIRAEGVNAEAICAVGIPAQSILETIGKRNVDLLVLATHGRSGVRRLVLGSVADILVREAGIPVLLVRAAHVEHPEAVSAGPKQITVI